MLMWLVLLLATLLEEKLVQKVLGTMESLLASFFSSLLDRNNKNRPQASLPSDSSNSYSGGCAVADINMANERLPTKKPKEEFELWGAYAHKEKLFQKFALSSTDLRACCEGILTYLRSERRAVGAQREQMLTKCGLSPLLDHVVPRLDSCKIGKMMAHFDSAVAELDGTDGLWEEYDDNLDTLPESLVQQSVSSASALKNQLKLIGLKYSALLQCVQALFRDFERVLLGVQEDFKEGPRNPVLKTVRDVKEMMKRDLPTPDSPAIEYIRFFWALKILRDLSRTVFERKAYFLLDAALGFVEQNLGAKLDEYYLTCCKMRLAEELKYLDFDETGIFDGKEESRLFLVDNIPQVKEYLKGHSDHTRIKLWVDILKKKKVPHVSQSQKSNLKNSPVSIPDPQPTKKTTQETQVNGEAAGNGGEGKAKKKSKKKKPAVAVVNKAFQLHVGEVSLRLVMLAERLPRPKYDESLEDGAYLLLLETVNAIPRFIEFAALLLPNYLHAEFLQEWRTREESIISTFHTTLGKAASAGIPQYMDALPVLEKDKVLLAFACLQAKKYHDTGKYRFVKAAERRLLEAPLLSSFDVENLEFDPSVPTTEAMAKKFLDEVDLSANRHQSTAIEASG